MWNCKALLLLLIVLVFSPSAWGQNETQETSPRWVWYVVRPGDTIEGLTARYLGSNERWRENAELNQETLPDPSRIRPGQQIKLLLPTELPADGALIRKVANRVEDQPTPLDWRDARTQNLLRALDGVKTHSQSSAELEFGDQTRLLVTEDSIVFIGEEEVSPEPVDRTQIEILVGQADLEGPSDAGAQANQFEIVLGDAKATPRAGEDSALQTRARRAEGGGAQLMVYSGESALEAAGAKVQVATGMGSSVPQGEPPKPPEKLLPAPKTRTPAAGSALATPRPEFRWAAVEDAQSYTLEICRDARCGALLERLQNLSRPSWQPTEEQRASGLSGLPVAKLFWRVTAVSASGLDGYPSQPVDFEILSEVEDTIPPEVQISFTGPQLAPRSGLNDYWIVGPGMEIEVEVEDSLSGVQRWTPKINREKVTPEALRGPWERGAYKLTVIAVDRAGNRHEEIVSFVFDPDPPDFSWGIEGSSELGNSSGEPSDGAPGPSKPLRGRRELKIGRHDWQLDSDMAEILVRPWRGKPVGLAGLGALDRRQGLWILAQDAVCSELDDLSYELVPGTEKGSYVLHFSATDCIGNTRRGQLSLVKQKR